MDSRYLHLSGTENQAEKYIQLIEYEYGYPWKAGLPQKNTWMECEKIIWIVAI